MEGFWFDDSTRPNASDPCAPVQHRAAIAGGRHLRPRPRVLQISVGCGFSSGQPRNGGFVVLCWFKTKKQHKKRYPEK